MTAASDDISGYQQRRAEIGEAIAGVERALSAPAGTGDAWYERVLAAFLELSRVAHTQRAATQGPDGLLAEISREKPVLARVRTNDLPEMTVRKLNPVIFLSPNLEKIRFRFC